ncbi:MAG: site-2 protease family protein [Sedimentisphaerales bacterium]
MNNDVALGLAWYVVFVLSLSFHEAAHAFAAMKLGDKTAYYGGQVSLHPFAHMRREPIGMIVLPIISYILNGWMIGWASAPYDTAWAQRHPKREIMMAMAGPAGNLILAIAGVVIIRVGYAMGYFSPPDSITFSHIADVESAGWANSIAVMTSILFTLNLVLFVFNLLPIPPLDGSCLVPLVLDSENAYKYKALTSQPSVAIIGLVIAWQVFGYIFAPIHLFAINLLYAGHHYGG